MYLTYSDIFAVIQRVRRLLTIISNFCRSVGNHFRASCERYEAVRIRFRFVREGSETNDYNFKS